MTKLSQPLRLLFFGMYGQLSALPLAGLLEAGIPIAGVVVPAAAGKSSAPPIQRRLPPAQTGMIPLLKAHSGQTIVDMAWERSIPVFEVSRPGHQESLATLAALQPDLACVSCFSRRIPALLLSLPRLGFLNLHPSLLPAYRGPAPIFWALRSGERRIGVTLHMMDAGLDTGDILLQEPVDLSDGLSGPEIERSCAIRGARLMVQALEGLRQGSLQQQPQPQGGSYQRWPTAADFMLDQAWSARRAYNFMRGTAEWGELYGLELGGRWLALSQALSYEPDACLATPLRREGAEALIQFSPGVLRALVAEDSSSD